jgi:hypothetical protein
VVVSYVVTAGFVVLIIIAYYLFNHKPELDPFHKENQTPRMLRPNPVDDLVLKKLRKNKSHTSSSEGKTTHLEQSLIKVR